MLNRHSTSGIWAVRFLQGLVRTCLQVARMLVGAAIRQACCAVLLNVPPALPWRLPSSEPTEG